MDDTRKTNNKLMPVSQLVDGVLGEIKQRAEKFRADNDKRKGD